MVVDFQSVYGISYHSNWDNFSRVKYRSKSQVEVSSSDEWKERRKLIAPPPFSDCTVHTSIHHHRSPSSHSFPSSALFNPFDIKKMKTSFAAIVVATMAVSVQGFAPQASRVSSTKLAVVDDKTEVREYFNTEGFNRWNKIYSESDEVNTVQLDIRTGHGQTIQKILNWVDADGDINGKSVCDCGCGVGSLAIPLAQMGKFTVSK